MLSWVLLSLALVMDLGLLYWSLMGMEKLRPFSYPKVPQWQLDSRKAMENSLQRVLETPLK